MGHEKLLDELFTRVLTALTDQGVARVERISQDGKRVRAGADSSSFHREQTLRRRLKEVHDYVEELKRQPDDEPGESARRRAAQERAARDQQRRLELALALLPELQAARNNPKNSKKDRVKPVRVSRTDPQARKMKMADGGIRPAYNLQLACDTSSGAIVGVKVYAPLPKGKGGEPVTFSRWDTAGTSAWRARMPTDAGRPDEATSATRPPRVRPNRVQRSPRGDDE